MKKNYVLIDYENVQPEVMNVLSHDGFHVLVFVGSNQTKVTYEVASALQRMGDRATYIKISSNGNNALDFHIAYYIGHLSAKEADANFYIVSKDTGFTPLLQHLKSKKVSASRVTSISGIPSLKVTATKSASDRISVVISNLVKSGAAKPRTIKTLSRAINSLFQKSLAETEINHIIDELTKKGVVKIDQTKVSYTLPSGE
jgi:hypothetical protein